MMVGRKRALSDADAEALYRDYCKWLEARERYGPRALSAKYGISVTGVAHYGKRRHKSLPRVAA